MNIRNIIFNSIVVQGRGSNKMRKWYKNSKIFKKIIKKIGCRGSHGD